MMTLVEQIQTDQDVDEKMSLAGVDQKVLKRLRTHWKKH